MRSNAINNLIQIYNITWFSFGTSFSIWFNVISNIQLCVPIIKAKSPVFVITISIMYPITIQSFFTSFDCPFQISFLTWTFCPGWIQNWCNINVFYNNKWITCWNTDFCIKIKFLNLDIREVNTNVLWFLIHAFKTYFTCNWG